MRILRKTAVNNQDGAFLFSVLFVLNPATYAAPVNSSEGC